MGILLAFAPFIVFAIVDRLGGSTMGLIAGAVVSAILLLRDFLTPGRSPKILEIGTLVLFCGLTAYALFGSPTWSVIAVRLYVDSGLLIIVLTSMVIGRPFTMQYAREQVAREYWGTPEFIQTNYVIAAVCALAFAVMVIAEFALLRLPNFPRRAGIIMIILALVGAVKFTGWYPDRRKAKESPLENNLS
jgi:hypothetical protein